MRIVSYSVDDGEDYGFMASNNEFVPRYFVEEVLGHGIPKDVKELLPDRELLELIEAAVNGVGLEKVSLDSVHLRPPIPDPRKIICLGLNYMDHVEELGAETPDDLVIFLKPPTALTGPFDPIVKPRMVEQLDYEGEMAIVIADRCKDAEPSEAIYHVFGYMVFNDVSARDIQFKDGQWTRGKSFDTFAPTGPWITSREEVGDPHSLRIITRVNREIRQNSNTGRMIFKVSSIVSGLSQVMTLEPGDIIATGTPSGVGYSWRPEPRLLKPGDVVEVWIEGLGAIRNQVVEEPRP